MCCFALFIHISYVRQPVTHRLPFSDIYSRFDIRVKVLCLFPYAEYDNTNTNYDFSMLTLATTVNWAANSHIRPICLPTTSTVFDKGDDLVVSGWGTTSSKF